MGPRFDLWVGGYIANYSGQRKRKIVIFEVDGSIFDHAQAKSTQMRQYYSPYLGGEMLLYLHAFYADLGKPFIHGPKAGALPSGVVLFQILHPTHIMRLKRCRDTRT